MPVTNEEIRKIVLYFFLHKFFPFPYSKRNAEFVFDAIKKALKGE